MNYLVHCLIRRKNNNLNVGIKKTNDDIKYNEKNEDLTETENFIFNQFSISIWLVL